MAEKITPQEQQRNDPSFNFKIDIISHQKSGSPQKKFIAQIEDDPNETRFFKQVYSFEDTTAQTERQRFFKENGVAVPEIYEAVQSNDGDWYLVAEDLTKGGKYLVMGLYEATNGKETLTEKYKEIARKIPQETKLKIAEDIVHACEASIKTRKNKQGEEVVYDTLGTGYMLAIDPTDPKNSKVYIGDFGVTDIFERSTDVLEHVRRLTTNAAVVFFSTMTGEEFPFPEKFGNLWEEAKANSKEALEYFWSKTD